MSGVYDYSETPSSNTSINGIDIGEGCAAGNLNNAQRQMMADIASFIANAILDQVTSNGRIGRDGNLYLDLYLSNPILNFDVNDYLLFDRTSNTLAAFVGGTQIFAANLSAFNVLRPLQQNGNQVWHAANLTNVSQLANDAGYMPATGGTFTGGISAPGVTTPTVTLAGGIAVSSSGGKAVILVGGSPVASVDSAGNLRVLGNVTASAGTL